MNSSRKTLLIVAIIVVILILGIGAWYAFTNPTISSELGFKPAVSAASSPRAYGMNLGSTTSGGRYGGVMRGGFATGSIEVLNDNGFTLSVANGATQNIDLVATTTIQNYASASSTPTTITADQLSVGEQVLVIGTPNSDGSITARTVRTGVLPTPGSGGRRGGGAYTPPTASQ